MKISLLIIITLLSFSACKKEEKLKFPVLITSEYDTIIHLSSNKMMKNNSIVYGINIKDTLDFSLDKIIDEENFTYYQKNIKTDSIVVYVDAENSSFHSHEINYLEFISPPAPKILDSVYNEDLNSYKYEYADFSYDEFLLKTKNIKEKRKRKHFSTYPVYIYNQGASNRIISSSIVNGGIYLLLEAKDKRGVWRPIEYNDVPYRTCGADYQFYLLKPKHYLVSSIIKYSGEYETTMRVKFMTSEKIYYSNEFEGSLSYSQFDVIDEINLLNKKFSDTTNEIHQYKNKLIFLDFD